MDTIESPCVVALTWELADAQGRDLEQVDDPVEYLVGGDDLLPAMEAALAGHVEGDVVALKLEPDDAYGDYDADLVCFEERALFPEGIEPGMQLEGLPAGARTEGMPPDLLYLVTEVYDSHVVLDGNHPLAGIGLQWRAKVHDVRAATPDEVQARSAGRPWLTVGPSNPPPDATRH